MATMWYNNDGPPLLIDPTFLALDDAQLVVNDNHHEDGLGDKVLSSSPLNYFPLKTHKTMDDPSPPLTSLRETCTPFTAFINAPRAMEPAPMMMSPYLKSLRDSNFAMLAATEPIKSQATALVNYDQHIDTILNIWRPSSTTSPKSNKNKTATATKSAYKVTKSSQLRSTCEPCRKLKIKSVASPGGGPFEKCVKRGTQCVHLPRAGYRSRTNFRK